MTSEAARQALADCRERIDAVDRRILALLNERARIVEEVGRIKTAAGMPILEPKREQDVLRNVSEHNQGPLEPDAAKRIFERVITEMRDAQRMRREAGPEGDAPR